MSYQSSSFFLFVAAILFVYYRIDKQKQKWVLLIANLLFYVLAGFEYLPFLVITLLASFFVGKYIGKAHKETEASLKNCSTSEEKKQVRHRGKAKAKRILQVGLLIALGLLAICKYTNFVVRNINNVLGLFSGLKIELFNIILPLGISYYTFMAVSYVLDVYWKRYEAESDFVMYAVYLSFFPHIVQGPIDRYNKIKPQIQDGVAYNPQNITFGAQLSLWGLFKKLVIADRLGPFVNEIYSNYGDYRGIIFLLATVFYTIQLYADFSGCVDIATGVGQMFGITIAKNFDHPFFSRTIPEYWRRWHISLMEWFKDYMYYPISSSKFFKNTKKIIKGKGHLKAEAIFTGCFPAFVIWFTTGIWHGAAWKYIVWGMYNAILVAAGIIFADYNKKLTDRLRINTESFMWKVWQIFRTFVLTCIGRVFARADSLLSGIQIWKNAFSELGLGAILGNNLYSYGITEKGFEVLIISVFILFAVDFLQERISIREELAKQSTALRWIIIYVAIFAVLIFGCYGPGYDAAAFIYGKY